MENLNLNEQCHKVTVVSSNGTLYEIDFTAFVLFLTESGKQDILTLEEDLFDCIGLLTQSIDFTDGCKIPPNYQNVHSSLHVVTKLLRHTKVEISTKLKK